MPAPFPPVTLQSMPPRAAHFCLGLERFCREECNLSLEGTRIVVAYSGGADSRALLLAFHALAPRLGLTLHAAILDHGLRAEAAGEVAGASALCGTLGVTFHTEKADVAALAREGGLGLEEAGREARLDFLRRVRETTQSDWVAFGHQLNDLAEDSIMRLIRGSGWPAMAGMEGVCRERRIIRPLLLTPRGAVEDFLRTLGVPWVDDVMNEDATYLRNRVRAGIVPLLLRENPNFLDTVAERWRMARDDAAFMAEQVEAVSAIPEDDGVFLDKTVLEGCPPAIRHRKYLCILASLGAAQATARLVRALDAAWRRGEGGKKIQFPGRREALIRRGGILFRRSRGQGHSK